MIKYKPAPDIQKIAEEVVARLGWLHVDLQNVAFIRSFDGKSRGTIARCHALGKAMQVGMGRRGFYLIEVISKRFDKLSNDEKVKTVIHELMHIPKSFGGGFRHHNLVNEKNVNQVWEKYVRLKENDLDGFF